jgi:hypothetical protein
MKKKYPVILSDPERVELKSLIAAGNVPARMVTPSHQRRGEDSNPRRRNVTGVTAFEAAALVHSATSPT